MKQLRLRPSVRPCPDGGETAGCQSLSRLLVGLVAFVILAGACGSDDEPGTNTTRSPSTTPTTAVTTTSTTVAPTTTTMVTTSTAATTTTAPPGALIEVAPGDFGSHLVDGDGMALYLHFDDAQGASTCYDTCAATWPPLTKSVTAGEGVDASLLGTSRRTDGSDQVTYNRWPLYYYTADQAPGDANGQGLGGAWFVVDPSGDPVGQAG